MGKVILGAQIIASCDSIYFLLCTGPPGHRHDSHGDLSAMTGGFRLDRIQMSYKNKDVVVLQTVSFQVLPGEIGLVKGKT